eukprot:CAMPEP_0194390128 /NCGR_PEP_ID=MMETSP0174-20130528/108211_1 /TAXON_ID=216777 /ORGANISM="Proboscia alata, Strain PI-D3" /LENGTH=274 /DNA_ID=CAMNT_0039183147 /DNA_START=146 /DNA_END=970 /DNA_ORIENTATION=+
MSILAPPKLSLIPPGQCQFTTEFVSSKLISRSLLPGGTTSVLKFDLPDESKPLNLSTCACILAKINGDDNEVICRPYTPVSTNALVGSFDLLVKHYENGKMSGHMKTMEIGSEVDFKHIEFNVKIQAPFTQYSEIGMIVGGTGITPMIQALHAILGDPDNTIKVTMLYGSRESSDILGSDLLELWEKDFPLLKVINVLSNEPVNSKWTGERGFINAELVKAHMPSPSLGDKGIIFICGPPPMYAAICGERGSKEVPDGTVLKDLGYESSQVYKF